MKWLGRQVGYVARAIKTDPVEEGGEPKVVFRKDRVQEAPHPNDPNLKLRRTTIDEVVVEKRVTDESGGRAEE
jgi:hypothetical protein